MRRLGNPPHRKGIVAPPQGLIDIAGDDFLPGVRHGGEAQDVYDPQRPVLHQARQECRLPCHNCKSFKKCVTNWTNLSRRSIWVQ